MVDSKFFSIPFGVSGDRTTIPEDTQSSGAVSYQQGFGPDYERNPATDPLAKRVPRDETNELYYQVTNALRFLQLYGAPEWYAVDDGGDPVQYPLSAQVRHDAGSGMQIWRSLVGANTAEPGTDPTKWAVFSTPIYASSAEARALAATDRVISPSTLKSALYQPIPTLASATSMDLSTTTAEVIYVTGTASIGALGTMPEGTFRTLRFTSTPTLVHSSALYLSNGGNNIAIQAGDSALFVSTGSGNWLMLGFQRWTPIAPQAVAEAGADNTQIMTALRVAQYVAAILASQSVAEAGSDNTKLMTPLRVEQHMLANMLGWGQTVKNVAGSRTAGTAYSNLSGRPIVAWIAQTGQSNRVEQSDDGITYSDIGGGSGNSGEVNVTTAIIPHGGWIKVGPFSSWKELS